MTELNLYNIISKSLIYYDNKNKEYKNFIRTSNYNFNRENNTIKFPDIDDKTYNYEILGYFDYTTNIWLWGWMLPGLTNKETKTVNELLFYGLKINRENPKKKMEHWQYYLKTQLVNSRFLLRDFFQLELHLAIASYLLKDQIKFIYPIKEYLSKEKNKYIIKYWIIY